MKYKCFCCGYLTLPARGEFEICPVCFWEDDMYLIFNDDINFVTSLYEMKQNITEDILLDLPSGANHGLTLREGKMNYKKFGACDEEMVEHVRPPRKKEYPPGGSLL